MTTTSVYIENNLSARHLFRKDKAGNIVRVYILATAMASNVCERTEAPNETNSSGYHVAGLVLARGGSQGIHLKNIAVLRGKPLLSWALDAMAAMGKFDSVWVSTDHPAIAECAKRHEGVRVFRRSPEFAKATSSSAESVREFLEARPEVDAVGLVQCTSPFVRPEFLRAACDIITAGQADSVFSVTRDKKFRWSEIGDGDTTAVPLNFDPARRPRRQDWKGYVVENGMFYFCRRELPVKLGTLQGGPGGCKYLEVPNRLSVDIDTSLDLAFAEQVAIAEERVQAIMLATSSCGCIKPS